MGVVRPQERQSTAHAYQWLSAQNVGELNFYADAAQLLFDCLTGKASELSKEAVV